MGKFILGVIVTLLVLILGGLGFAMLGFFPRPPTSSLRTWNVASPWAPSTPPWSAMPRASPTRSRPPTRISKTA